MKKFKKFAVRHPIVFGFIVIVLFTLLSTLVWPITQIFSFPEGLEIGTALSKLVITACFTFILWRFGWVKTAGFASPGRKQVWLLAFVMMIYNAVFAAFAGAIAGRRLLRKISLSAVQYMVAAGIIIIGVLMAMGAL